MSHCSTCATYYKQLHNGGTWRKRTLQPLNLLMLLIGVGLMLHYRHGHTHISSIPWETLALITFLGIMLSFTRVWQFVPRSLPTWSYVPIAGVASAFMDSFLVLVIIASMSLVEQRTGDLLRFKAIVMLSALIGGLLTYFGEVYALPIALKYHMREWYSMLWIVPPVVLFLVHLTKIAKTLQVAPHCALPEAQSSNDTESKTCVASVHPWERPENRPWMILKLSEFVGFIALLLAFKDPLLLIGIMLFYYSIQGHGMSTFSVWKFESEEVVLLLLVAIGVWAHFIAPVLADLPTVGVFALATLNAVAVAVVYPVSGNVYFDIYVVSVAVLITPASSLVGLIVFKKPAEWWFYMRHTFGLVLRWAVYMGVWVAFMSVPYVENTYYDVTGFDRPTLTLPMEQAH